MCELSIVMLSAIVCQCIALSIPILWEYIPFNLNQWHLFSQIIEFLELCGYLKRILR